METAEDRFQVERPESSGNYWVLQTRYTFRLRLFSPVHLVPMSSPSLILMRLVILESDYIEFRLFWRPIPRLAVLVQWKVTLIASYR